MSLPNKTMIPIASILNPEPLLGKAKLAITYWPVLRDTLLNSPSTYDHLHLECGICLDPMTVFPHEHSYDPNMSHFSHRARILPCGHMFGSKCAHTMIRDAIMNSSSIVCPICRTDFAHHRGCGHVHTGIPMPTSTEAILRFPPTLSEGGVVADKCGDCQVTDIIMGINHLAPMLTFPSGLHDKESFSVTATTLSSYWAIRSACPAGMCNFVVEDVSLREMEGPLPQICEEVKKRLRRNITKTWQSMDFGGFDLELRLYELGPDGMDG
ncbi:hypothetical protein F66182_6685 [Fusarium sp. NRRL 66182]|nr:hypothetical protein F66182_6685 [Fusarium sp. NRRL 66182]